MAAPGGGWSVILHSDRGSQFRSSDYQRFLNQNTLACTMSAVGHCGDNAACEGFFGMLKRERTNRRIYRTMDIAKADLFDYIERFHNPRMRRRVARSDLQLSTFLKPSVETGVKPGQYSGKSTILLIAQPPKEKPRFPFRKRG